MKLIIDRIYRIIVFILAAYWLMLAIPSSLLRLYRGRNSLLNIYHYFAYKTENEKVKIIARDIFPTITICHDFVPKKAKLLIVFFPFKEPFRVEYYLYPRLIYWYDDKDSRNVIKFCKDNGISYYIVYDNNRKPILRKVE